MVSSFFYVIYMASIILVVSTEARATYNLGHAGLIFWCPNVNVARDPRWGMLEDLNSRPLKVSSSCRHFAAYDLDNWLNVDRNHFNARQDMAETFLRPFEACVREGDVSGVMCSFNNINGIPPCADPRLLKGTIRDEWNLHGYIVSDCWSIETTKNSLMSQVRRLCKYSNGNSAGLDLECGHYYNDSPASAVMAGRVSQHDLDQSLSNLYVVLMRLGFFDSIPALASLGKDDICSAQHIELAREAARQGIVLLKNDNATLPLKSVKKLALVRPNANAYGAMMGNYAGPPCRSVSPRDAFSAIGNVTYEMECGDVLCHNDTYVYKAVEAAKHADTTIIVVGTDVSIETEDKDRVDLLLPGYQTHLVNQIAKATTAPIILVVMCGGPIDISFARDNPRFGAILWAGFPGEEGGNAIADVVYGKYESCYVTSQLICYFIVALRGRLTVTWYENGYVGMLPMTSMALRPVESLEYPGRTYKFFSGSIVYPFDYGLSYTNFSYSLTAPTRSIHIHLKRLQPCRSMAYSICSTFEFEVAVKNVGSMDGSEVVIVYSSPPSGIVGTHIKQVIGFERVFFSMNVCQCLGIVDISGYTLLPSGSTIFSSCTKHRLIFNKTTIIYYLKIKI
ncbi:hypothetical protein PVL29_005656 [Vitis rotundifolia]|uniref:Fibronectin type III-like domain-containing protein n=1 Tax=Vitis rotundifolia TaxID=103349 RepID=A0AA39A2S7_VITRO|nr:hypothetical protein PVL29_005656 [Vitis rotundifolia]